MRRLLESSQHDFPVIDSQGRLLGALSLADIREFLREEGLDHLILARDCVHPMRTLVPQDSLLEALDTFEATDMHEIPVVMGDRLVGSLHRADVLRTYRRALAEASAPT